MLLKVKIIFENKYLNLFLIQLKLNLTNQPQKNYHSILNKKCHKILDPSIDLKIAKTTDRIHQLYRKKLLKWLNQECAFKKPIDLSYKYSLKEIFSWRKNLYKEDLELEVKSMIKSIQNSKNPAFLKSLGLGKFLKIIN